MKSNKGKRDAACTLQVIGIVLAMLLCGQLTAGSAGGQTITVDMRSRVAIPDAEGQFRVTCEKQQWDPDETAIIICDMWNQHWCRGATNRVAELAPVMNDVVSTARDEGVLIVHAPSGTIDHYENHPARRTATEAPRAVFCPRVLSRWGPLPPRREG